MFCPCWHEIRGILVSNEKGSVGFWERSGMILYLVGWSSTKSLLWKVVIWFCSVAAEQTMMWFFHRHCPSEPGPPQHPCGVAAAPTCAEPTAGPCARANAMTSAVLACLLPAESLQGNQIESHLPNAVILRQMSSAFWSNHPQSCDHPLFHPGSPQHCTLGWLLLLRWLVCFSFLSEALLVCQFTPAENQICMSSVLFI